MDRRGFVFCIVLMLMCIGFVANALSQNVNNLEEERWRLVRDTGAEQNSSPLNGLASGEFLDEMKAKYKQKNESILQNSGLRSVWFSKDPADLAPLQGTTWKLNCTYVYGTAVCKDYTIRFGGLVLTASDGTVGLECMNQHGDIGALFFTEFPSGLGGGRGFCAVFDFEEKFCLLRFYYFKVSDNSASGYHVHRLCGATSNGHPITGYKVSGPTTTTTSTTTTSTTSTTTTTLPAVPTKPTLGVETSGTTVSLSWTSVAGAEGYTLYYAPYPKADPIGNIPMGDKTSMSASLPDGSAFYVALQAYNSFGNSGYSNIDHFAFGSLVSISPNSLNLEVDETGACTIAGGTEPYSAISSSTATAAAVSIDGSTLYVTGASEGNATIDVTDSAGDLATVSVTVGGSALPTYTNSLGMTFVLLPAWMFTMGSPEDEPERDSGEIQHQVTLTQPFYMQQTEVTQGQWEAVMGSNPSDYSGCPNCPVEGVSWDDAQDYIVQMNLLGEGTYSLPTEAQWEYAVRAGSTTAFYNGDMTGSSCGYDPNLDVIGWYCYNDEGQTSQVAQKTPNAWGLYDMSGNVREWCQDWYGEDYYSSSAVTDPAGPSSGRTRVWRGGGIGSFPETCRSANRAGSYAHASSNSIGFRLTRKP